MPRLRISRRDLLKFGGMGLLGAAADAVWPLQLAANGTKAKPRGAARNVLFYEISGAISHIEGFDFKESKGMPKDLDVRKVRNDLHLSNLLFPKVSKQMDKVAILRSMLNHDAILLLSSHSHSPHRMCTSVARTDP